MAGRHGRFLILTDEHVPLALVQALRQAGWTVMRVEDDPGLGKGTDDRIVFAHAARGTTERSACLRSGRSGDRPSAACCTGRSAMIEERALGWLLKSR